MSQDSFEGVVIGSGFGGTILSLSLANKFAEENKNIKIDRYLERIFNSNITFLF